MSHEAGERMQTRMEKGSPNVNHGRTQSFNHPCAVREVVERCAFASLCY